MLTDRTIGSFFSLDKSKIMINQKMLEPTPSIINSSSPVKVLK